MPRSKLIVGSVWFWWLVSGEGDCRNGENEDGMGWVRNLALLNLTFMGRRRSHPSSYLSVLTFYLIALQSFQ